MSRMARTGMGLMLVGIALIFVSVQTARAEADGKALYDAKKCSMCHAIDGKGGKMGPDLSAVGSKQTAEWIAKFLKDPKAVNPKSKMPTPKGTDEEFHAIAGYLASLKGAK